MFFDENNQLSKAENYFLDRINKSRLVKSFECDDDRTLSVGLKSYIIYSDQSLLVFDFDGPVCHVPWSRDRFDVIQEIRWSTHLRSYLIMTADRFFVLTSSPYEIFSSKRIDSSLQYFCCHQLDLWLVSLSRATLKQMISYYSLSEWDEHDLQPIYYSLDRFGLKSTDRICSIECDRQGACLALLTAESNETSTGDVQRRRQLILIDRKLLTPLRTIYFQKNDHFYWYLTSITTPDEAYDGWLLGEPFSERLTFLDYQQRSKMSRIDYHKPLRNVVSSVDGQYIFLRTINSLDIYHVN